MMHFASKEARRKKRKEKKMRKIKMNAIISAHKSISFIVNAITKRRIKRKENEEFVKFSRFATLWIRSSAQKKKYKREGQFIRILLELQLTVNSNFSNLIVSYGDRVSAEKNRKTPTEVKQKFRI